MIRYLWTKQNFSSHYRVLKFDLRQGMEAIKFYTVNQIDQKPWLVKYINANAEQKAGAMNVFE